MNFIRLYWYQISALLIFFLALILRFYNYFERWGLAYDQAQFAIVARFALESHKLPLLGPFSSGGPFQTGGEWYWVVMTGTSLFPTSIISAWVFLTFAVSVSVLLMVYLGKIIENKTFGLIAGILITVSNVQITQSTNLTNQTPIILFSIFALIGMVKFVKSKSNWSIFLMSFSIGIASSIHIQAVALLPLIFWTLIFTKQVNVKNVLLTVLGVFLPWLPVLIADYGNNFYNTRSMLTYYSSAQGQVPYEVLGRRWLTFLGVSVPSFWANIIGGHTIWGYILILLTAIAFLYTLFKKKLSVIWWIVILSTFTMLIIVRYTRTPLFESFLIFLNPFIFLLTAKTIHVAYSFSRYVGILFLLIIAFSSVIHVREDILLATNTAYKTSVEWRDRLLESYPDKKFTIYDYEVRSTGQTLPFVLLLETENRIDKNGIKVGFANLSRGVKFKERPPVLIGDLGDLQGFLLEGLSERDLKKFGWKRIDPEVIYDSVQNWYK